ncbi:MAG TPA: hypothetical protein VK925_12780 [Jiangellaceae bacterium]|nr:hypothetical protein [Jiangellaceae bacterium]
MTTLSAQPALVDVSRPRRIGFTVLAALLALFTGVAMGGIPALVQTFTVTGHDVVHQIHYIHWAAFMGVLVAVPLTALAFRPTVAAAQHAAVVVVAFVAAAAVAQMFDPAIIIFPVLIGLLLWLHPRRGELFRAGEGFSAQLGLLAAAVTIPSLWYGWSEIQVHLAAPLSDPHRGPPEAHYVSSAALVFAVIGAAWLASTRTTGWRLPAWCAGLAMGMTGAASIWLPGWVSSFDRVWGTAALVWGIAFVAVAEWLHRRAVAAAEGPARP